MKKSILTIALAAIALAEQAPALAARLLSIPPLPAKSSATLKC